MSVGRHTEAAEMAETAAEAVAQARGRGHPAVSEFWETVAEAREAAGDKEAARAAKRQAAEAKKVAAMAYTGGSGGAYSGAVPQAGRGDVRQEQAMRLKMKAMERAVHGRGSTGGAAKSNPPGKGGGINQPSGRH